MTSENAGGVQWPGTSPKEPLDVRHRLPAQAQRPGRLFDGDPEHPGRLATAHARSTTRRGSTTWPVHPHQARHRHAVLAVGVAGGARYAGLTPGNELPPPHPAATQVRLEQTSSSGSNPFLATPVGQDQSNIAPAGAGGQFTGDTPGLFGDTGDSPSCDARRVSRRRRLHPDLDSRATRMLTLGGHNWATEWWNPNRGSLRAVITTTQLLARQGLAAP